MSDEINQSHEVSQFVKLGKELLEQTERPNVITLSQFEPYMTLFKPDHEKLKTDIAYRESMTRMQHDYRVKLGINPYFPTLVVDKLPNPTRVLLFLDRWFSRIKSDNVVENSERDLVPSNVNKMGGDHRDALILSASIKDLMSANTSEEQSKIFQSNRAESALMLKIFLDNNLTPEKREELLKQHMSSTEEIPESQDDSAEFGLDDED